MSSVASPQSYKRSADECGSSAAMTQHHTRGPPCSIAREAASRLLDDSLRVRGRAVTCPCNARNMAVACSACHMLLGATGQTSCPGTRGFFITSTNTAGACGMSLGVHLHARHTGPNNRRQSLRTL